MVYRGRTSSTPEEEARLDRVWPQALPLKEMNYRGYTARRRGRELRRQSTIFPAQRLEPSAPLPAELEPLRDEDARPGLAYLAAGVHADAGGRVPRRARRWAGTVTCRTSRTWSACRCWDEGVMRFRPYPPREPKKADVIKLTIEPRSIYLLRGPARWAWQTQRGAGPPTCVYSITFRTARKLDLKARATKRERRFFTAPFWSRTSRISA